MRTTASEASLVWSIHELHSRSNKVMATLTTNLTQRRNWQSSWASLFLTVMMMKTMLLLKMKTQRAMQTLLPWMTNSQTVPSLQTKLERGSDEHKQYWFKND